MSKKTILRFAPSNTNQSEDINNRGLHAGSLKTILFNYAEAKRDNGFIIMRLENTDVERSNEDSLKCMIRDLDLVGIQFDAGFKFDKDGNVLEFNNTGIDFGPLRQSDRKPIYKKYADKLMEKGLAYEEDGAIWFKMPKDDVNYYDEVLGGLTLPANQAQDLVIMKSSGMPSFYFAVTIDDHEMGITKVMRGGEHVNSTYRQVALQKALDLRELKYATLPLIFNEQKKKLSKRDATGQVNVYDFIKDGFLPEALIGYLSRLGWSPDKEIGDLSLDYFVQNFDIGRILTVNPVFDYKKLTSINAEMIRKMKYMELYNAVMKYGERFHSDKLAKINETGKVEDFILMNHQRIKTLKEIFFNCEWTFQKPKEYSKQDYEKINFEGVGLAPLKHFSESLGKTKRKWTVNSINDLLKETVEKGYPMGKIAQQLRLATTGNLISPPIDKVLHTIGKNEVKERIKALLEQ